MIPARRHIRRETAVSVVINVLLSLGFFLLVFGTGGPVQVWGIGKFAFDFVPQAFMIALMSTLVPGALATRKLRAGVVANFDGISRLPRSLIPRAFLLASVAVVAGAGIAALSLMASEKTELEWTTALLIKLTFGAALATVITPLGLRAALARR